MQHMHHYQLNEPDVSAEVFDGEILTINLRTGHYHSLQKTAAIFFNLLVSGHSSQAAVDIIARHYSKEAAAISPAFDALLGQLLQQELLVPGTERPVADAHEWLAGQSTVYTVPSLDVYTDMQNLLLLDPIHDIIVPDPPAGNDPDNVPDGR